MSAKAELIDLTTEIVSAYVGHNTVPANDLAGLIHQVYGCLAECLQWLGEVADREI